MLLWPPSLRPQLAPLWVECLHRGAHHPGCLHPSRALWTHSLLCQQRTCWLLPVMVGENGPPPLDPGYQLLLAPDRHHQHLPPHGCPLQEGRRPAQQPHTGNRCTRHNILPGYGTTTPKTGTTPSTSQDQEEPARGEEGGRGRSLTRWPRGHMRDDRSSTQGSVKCCRGTHSTNPMDDVLNYVASGWKRDLTHIISCCWKAQVGPLTSSEWMTAINRFIRAMRAQKENEWVDIKELNPLRFMPYVTRLF